MMIKRLEMMLGEESSRNLGVVNLEKEGLKITTCLILKAPVGQ